MAADEKRGVDPAMVGHLDMAISTAGESMVCPFCSMWWDQAVMERLFAERDVQGYEAYLEEVRKLPVNAEGPALGHRPEAP